jgi:hypothetical protein
LSLKRLRLRALKKQHGGKTADVPVSKLTLVDELGVGHAVPLSLNDFLEVRLQSVETSVLGDERPEILWEREESLTRAGAPGGSVGRCRGAVRTDVCQCNGAMIISLFHRPVRSRGPINEGLRMIILPDDFPNVILAARCSGFHHEPEAMAVIS